MTIEQKQTPVISIRTQYWTSCEVCKYLKQNYNCCTFLPQLWSEMGLCNIFFTTFFTGVFSHDAHLASQEFINFCVH